MREGVTLRAAIDARMTTLVDAWTQAGRLFVWRYDRPSRARKGWHFAADAAGCRSFIDLLNRFEEEAAHRYRTVRLGTLTRENWSVPNFGAPQNDKFETMRIDYLPKQTALDLNARSSKLMMTIGETRLPDLRAALSEVGAGSGDSCISPSTQKEAGPWWFWWAR